MAGSSYIREATGKRHIKCPKSPVLMQSEDGWVHSYEREATSKRHIKCPKSPVLMQSEDGWVHSYKRGSSFRRINCPKDPVSMQSEDGWVLQYRKSSSGVLADVAHWVGGSHSKQKCCWLHLGSEHIYLGYVFDPLLESVQETVDQCFSLTSMFLSFSLPLAFKAMKKCPPVGIKKKKKKNKVQQWHLGTLTVPRTQF